MLPQLWYCHCQIKTFLFEKFITELMLKNELDKSKNVFVDNELLVNLQDLSFDQWHFTSIFPDIWLEIKSAPIYII